MDNQTRLFPITDSDFRTDTPSGPAVTSVQDGVTHEEIDNGGIIDNTHARISGTGTPNSLVYIRTGALETPRLAHVDSTGHWSLDVPLLNLRNDITVSDQAGHVSEPFNVTLGDIEPYFTFLSGRQVSAASAFDYVLLPGPVIEGWGKPGTTLALYDGDTKIAEFEVNGFFSYYAPAWVTAADHHLTLVSETGKVSAPLDVHISGVSAPVDPAPPADPGDPPQPIDPARPATEILSVQHDASGKLRIDGTADGSVLIYDNGKLLAQAFPDASGHWVLSLPLGAGVHALSLSHQGPGDAIGEPYQLTVLPDGSIGPGDWQAEQPPTILSAHSGAFPGQAALEGTATDNTPFKVYDNGRLIGTVTPDAHGHWALAYGSASSGEHELTLFFDGFETPLGEPFGLTVGYDGSVAPTNLVDPGKPVDPVEPVEPTPLAVTSITNAQGEHYDGDALDVIASRLTIQGTGHPGTYVQVYIDGKSAGGVSIDPQGHWVFGSASYFTPANLTEGAHTLQIKYGNEVSEPFNYVVEPLVKPVIEHVYDASGHDVAHGGFTDELRPTVSGSGAEPGTDIYIVQYDPLNGHPTFLGSASVQPDGTWEVHLDHDLVQRYTDSALAEFQAVQYLPGADPHTPEAIYHSAPFELNEIAWQPSQTAHQSTESLADPMAHDLLAAAPISPDNMHGHTLHHDGNTSPLASHDVLSGSDTELFGSHQPLYAGAAMLTAADVEWQMTTSAPPSHIEISPADLVALHHQVLPQETQAQA